MKLLTETELPQVTGDVIKKFRGDRSLLGQVISALFELPGRPVHGVVS